MIFENSNHHVPRENAGSGENPVEHPVHDFDLNVELDFDSYYMETLSPTIAPTPPPPTVLALAQAPASASVEPMSDEKHEEYPGWSLSEVENMAIDPIQLANFNSGIDEDEEDYDGEE